MRRILKAMTAWPFLMAGQSVTAASEPYEVKVNPPRCETTMVKAVYPAAIECRRGEVDMPAHPEDGDLHGCYGGGASRIAYTNGKFPLERVRTELHRLGDEPLPTKADVELVREVSRIFTVSHGIRRRVLDYWQPRNYLLYTDILDRSRSASRC